ncbi:hypothetical protein ASG65_27925 [Bacillus sp. Leaf13]|nr:hypothetical protein ASG65_27925 [Bacillus sp. Leaf13]
MQIGVKKIQTGDAVKIELQNPKFLPTWVNRPYEIIPMKALSDQSDKYNEIQKHMNYYLLCIFSIDPKTYESIHA